MDLSKSDPVLFQSLGDVKARRYNVSVIIHIYFPFVSNNSLPCKLLKSLTSLNHLLNRTLVKVSVFPCRFSLPAPFNPPLISTLRNLPQSMISGAHIYPKLSQTYLH